MYMYAYTDVVIKSFKACGISNNTDGSEDDMIHCLKPGEVAPALPKL